MFAACRTSSSFPSKSIVCVSTVMICEVDPNADADAGANGLRGFVVRAAGNGDGKKGDEVAEAEGRRDSRAG